MKKIALTSLWICLIGFSCSTKKEQDSVGLSDTSKVADSIKVLRDDSLVTIFIDYNLHSKYHESQLKRFENWGYDSIYYNQRIQAQPRKKGNITVPNDLKKIWIPVYSIDSIFYVQKDNDAQFRFEITDSTFNFFDGMQPVEPYVLDAIISEPGAFELRTRDAGKIVLKRVTARKTIYALKYKGNCAFVTPLADFNSFPIVVANGKKGATTIDDWLDLDAVGLCN